MRLKWERRRSSLPRTEPERRVSLRSTNLGLSGGRAQAEQLAEILDDVQYAVSADLWRIKRMVDLHPFEREIWRWERIERRIAKLQRFAYAGLIVWVFWGLASKAATKVAIWLAQLLGPR